MKAHANLCFTDVMNVTFKPFVVCGSTLFYNDRIAYNSQLSDTMRFGPWGYSPITTLGRFSAKPGTGKL
jgi:hypothetical protein